MRKPVARRWYGTDVDGSITRPYAAADAEAVAGLENLVEQHAGGHGGVTPSMLADRVAFRVGDVTSDSRVVFTADGTLLAYGLVVGPSAGGYVVLLDGGVHPEYRGRGVGRDLLGWQLGRAEELRQAAAPDRSWEAHCGAMVDDGDAARLFTRFGLAPVRYWCDMVAPTGPRPHAPLPDGLLVEAYHPGREGALHAAHMEAFADHWGYQWRALAHWAALTVENQRFCPELSLLAVAAGEIAGYVLCYESAEPDRLYVGQVGVRPPWRRRGLAGGLLAQVLAQAQQRGCARASLGVDAASPTGAVGVYERVGFTVDSRAVTYSVALGA